MEIVQYEPDGLTALNKGRFMDGPRISTRMSHVRITAGALEPVMKFYGDILGFTEIWRCSKDGQVPDIEKSAAQLEARRSLANYTQPMAIKTGFNRRRQLKLLNPDGTRSKLMELKTVDGVPAVSSTATPIR